MTGGPETPAAADVRELRELLLWARAEKIALGQVTIGSVAVVVHDLGIATQDRGPRHDPRSVYREFGGDRLAEVEAALERDDDEDAK